MNYLMQQFLSVHWPTVFASTWLTIWIATSFAVLREFVNAGNSSWRAYGTVAFELFLCLIWPGTAVFVGVYLGLLFCGYRLMDWDYARRMAEEKTRQAVFAEQVRRDTEDHPGHD